MNKRPFFIKECKSEHLCALNTKQKKKVTIYKYGDLDANKQKADIKN